MDIKNDNSIGQNKNLQNNKAELLVNNLIDNNIDKMNSLNKEAALVMKTQGVEAAVKHMFTDSSGNRLSYAEMRFRYG